ncbi:MAG: DNA replication/repair protein RecF, partial [Gemmatimonadota bacterium]
LDLVFPAEGVAVIGPNGSGKTNLVEALYYLEIFRSFRGPSDRQLVRFGEEVFHIRGRFEEPGTGAKLEVTAAYDASRNVKRVTVNGVEPERLGDALGRIGVVVFSPSDVSIIAGAPAERRRFLDIVLSVNVPGYLDALQRYRHTLKQRNALLKERVSPAELEPWTATLVRTGARVMAARARWVRQHGSGFARRYEAIGGEVPARMTYRPSVTGAEGDVGRLPEGAAYEAEDEAARNEEDAFRAELERVSDRERERGTTLRGPHRDDLGFIRQDDGGWDLRDFGSGGQQRTAAVSLRLVEAATIRVARGRAPIVLLDDIFAELDPGRGERLLEQLDREPGQAILTAPKASDIEVRRGRLPRWRIAGGQVVAAA